MTVYVNQFTGVVRKYENGEGWVLLDGGKWLKNGTPEKLIQNLPYYKVKK